MYFFNFHLEENHLVIDVYINDSNLSCLGIIKINYQENIKSQYIGVVHTFSSLCHCNATAYNNIL